MEKTIHKKIFCEGTPEEVWMALTDPAEISSWLMSTSDFRAEVGARFTMQAKPMGKWDGKIYGEVLIAEKAKILSYTWKGDQMKSNTVLTWTLTPVTSEPGDPPDPAGTWLTLVHTGFSGFSDYILGVFHSMGWKKFLRQLQNRVKRSTHEKEIRRL